MEIKNIEIDKLYNIIYIYKLLTYIKIYNGDIMLECNNNQIGIALVLIAVSFFNMGFWSSKASELRDEAKEIMNLSKWTDDNEKALNLFLESLKEEPDDAKTLRYVGRLYFLNKDYNNAEHYLSKSTEAKHDDWLTWKNLGWVYENLEKYEKMKDAFSNALNYCDHYEYYNYIGLAYAHLYTGDFTKAKELGYKALEIDNTKETEFDIFLLSLYSLRGDYVSANKQLIKKTILGIEFNEYKMIITRVFDGILADLAGLKAGDRIIKVNDTIATKKLLLESIKKAKFSDSMELLVERDGKEIPITVVFDFDHYIGTKNQQMAAAKTDKVQKTVTTEKITKNEDKKETVTKPEPPFALSENTDTNPPEIIPGDNIFEAVKAAHVIHGKVVDASGTAIVKVNGKEAWLDQSGNFEVSILLKPGKNIVVITAVDIYENRADKTIVVNRKVASRNQEQASQLSDIGKFYAVLIAAENYQSDTISDLNQPLQDAQKFKKALQKYSFDSENIILLENPNRLKIIRTFDDLSQKICKNDNLLIFFAGHGFWDKRFRQGYWLPVDAAKTTRANWISNSTVRDYIRGIQSKHTLVIADACFSGGIFKTRTVFDDALPSIMELHKMNSRKAITSGAMSEVPDRSVFVEYLIERLQENQKKYLPSEELFLKFKAAVINNSPIRQIPQIGTILQAGDEGGDFIFVRSE